MWSPQPARSSDRSFLIWYPPIQVSSSSILPRTAILPNCVMARRWWLGPVPRGYKLPMSSRVLVNVSSCRLVRTTGHRAAIADAISFGGLGCWVSGIRRWWRPVPNTSRLPSAALMAAIPSTFAHSRRGESRSWGARSAADGTVHLSPDLARNIARGDSNYLSVLDAADAYAAAQGLDLPFEHEARKIAADPECVTRPIAQLDLAAAGITSIIWATGYALDFSWIKVNAFDEKGRPAHQRGVSVVPGLYFLGLPWLSRRASPFIWGVWRDAEYLACHITARSRL